MHPVSRSFVPELPEVETIRRGLQDRLVGRRIHAAERPTTVALRKPSPLPLTDLSGAKVHAVRRHAKVLFLDLDDGRVLVAHLGMTGKFLFTPPGASRRAHTHLVLGLEEEELHFIDPRRFGWLALHALDDPPGDVDHYGMDALDAAFSVEHLEVLLASSRAPLKSFLLDQTKVAGLGNIYACEALWRAGLSPRRLAQNTPRGRVAPLRQAIVEVLADSLAQGGTSFNDYVNSIGEPGKFIADLAVFQREGKPCPRCDQGVRRIVQSGRSTFYCPGCQK